MAGVTALFLDQITSTIDELVSSIFRFTCFTLQFSLFAYIGYRDTKKGTLSKNKTILNSNDLIFSKEYTV